MKVIFALLVFLLTGCQSDEGERSQLESSQNRSSNLEIAKDTPSSVEFEKSGEPKPFSSFDLSQGKAIATNLASGLDVEIRTTGDFQLSVRQGRWKYTMRPTSINGFNLPTDSAILNEEMLEIKAGPLTSRFQNSSLGVSRSWVVDTNPSSSQLLSLNLNTSKDFTHEIDGDEVLVFLDGKYLFAWQTLRAWDSNNQDLLTRYKVEHGSLTIEVDTTNATFPIFIDPVATAPAWSTYGNGEQDYGSAVRFVGDVNGDGFTDVMVGQNRYSNNGPNGENHALEGRVLLFLGSSTGLAQSAAWSFEPDVPTSLIGSTIRGLGDIDGDGFDDVGVGWELAQVSSGGTDFTFAGKILVFHGQSGQQGFGSMTEVVNPSPTNSDRFGNVFTVGDFNCDGNFDLAVGSRFAASTAGKVWILLGDGNSFPTLGTVLQGTGTDNFGHSVGATNLLGLSINGVDCSDLVVGSSGYDSPGFNDRGRVGIYAGSALGISSTPVSTRDGSMAGATLGGSLAILGDINSDGIVDIAAGASGQNAANGAVYVFPGTATGIGAANIINGVGAERFGSSITVGDINGDGARDLIVAASNYTNPETNEGAVYVFQNNSGTFEQVQLLEGDVANGGYGFSIHSGFDLNGDSIDDLLIGARDYPSPNDPTRGGAAFAHYGVADCFIDGAFVAAGDASPTSACEVCDPSVSQTAYSPLSCDDGDQCTTDSCDTTLGCVNAVVADNTPCDDGLFCTENEVCTAGACGGGTPLDCSGSPGECFEAGVCNEAADQCDPPAPSPAGDACGGAVCQTAGTCDGAGTCQGAAPVDCSNLDTACTVGQCNATTGACEAVNVTNGTSCDDGDACTNNDVCGGGVCGGSAVACDDGNPCTVESCDPVLGCVSVPAADGLACDDGNACTSADSCTAGVCGGSAVTCDDGNECTVDSCDAVLGCQAAPASAGTTCDDGLFCTVNNACDGAGACVGAPRDCSNAAATCFEGVACDETADLCVPANPSASGTACGGDVCVDAGTCDGNGVCSGESNVDCSNLDTDCEIGVCDGTSGACVAQPRPDGTVCDDADACTENNICESGVCGGDAVVCEDDNNECTAPSCDPAQGCVFENLPFGSTCSESFCSADGTSVSAGICDGSGACTEDTTTLTSCAPYVCGVSAEGAACLSSCEEDVDCAEGFVCNGAECVEPGEDMGDMGTPDMGETDMGTDMGETDMGEPDMAIDDMGADMAGPDVGPQVQGQLEGSGLACASTDARPDHALLMLLVLGIGLRIRRR